MAVLVVDDSSSMRAIVRRALRQSSYAKLHVDEAADGRQALEYLRAHNPTFVLCDWNMPGMNGLELLGALRAEGLNARVGLVTSESTPERQTEALAAGARFLLPKPFEAVELERAVDLMLGGEGAHARHFERAGGKEVGGFFLPDPGECQRVLGSLLGKAITAVPWRRPLEHKPANYVGNYQCQGRAVAQVWMDPACAVVAGASLTLLPVRIAEEAVKSGSLPDNPRDGVGEVFNVLARLFQRPGGGDLRFEAWGHELVPLAGDVARSDLAVEVAGYGNGRMSLLVVP
jgi:two-component system chemotaxis response regulator CheY